mmetsp:Transcript_72949/g.89470  ORF Transcript_72949/g.89470 Transcript_72949/m.89470 type:complete len:289 (-) Transcript_72949:139-1005(-)
MTFSATDGYIGAIIAGIFDIITVVIIIHVWCKIGDWKETNDPSHSIRKYIIGSLIIHSLTVQFVWIYWLFNDALAGVVGTLILNLMFIISVSSLLVTLILRVDVTFRDEVDSIASTLKRIWILFVINVLVGIVGIVINALSEDNDALNIISGVIIIIYIVYYGILSTYILYVYITSMEGTQTPKVTYDYITKVVVALSVAIDTTIISVIVYMILEVQGVAQHPLNIILPFDVLMGCICIHFSLQHNFDFYSKICCIMEKICLNTLLRSLIKDKQQIDLQVQPNTGIQA